ncbi:MFS transporter [Nocardiopsis sp. NPDC050513]|uniref:MFS transporter n=1 Tax=Nocardiopsis sp. NPDC050513 TaxID=3364338 RepID=UPI0037AE1104
MSTEPPVPPTAARTSSRTAGREAGKVAFASFVGTAVEWYDFFLYGASAALVFGALFFPTDNALVSQLAALGTFTVGFVARPLGGIVAGHFGDRIGRKRMLVLSLMLMGVATVGVGLLPTYAAVGVAAPALLVLLRVGQGLAVGAEWGGAALMAVEHAPPNKRALYGSAPQLGVPAGAILANLVLLTVVQATGDAFMTWGWRIPFLLSVVLVVIGMFVRRRVTESPLFTEAAAAHPEPAQRRNPLVTVVREHPWAAVRGMFASVASTSWGYVILVFILSYGPTSVGYSRNTMLTLIILSSLLQVGAMLYAGRVADRIGRRKVALIGSGLQVIVAVAFFPAFDSGTVWLALTVCLIASVGLSAQYGPLPALLSEQFPTEVRYTGVSVSYMFGNILGGGLVPLVGTALVAATGTSFSVGLYMLGLSLVTAVAVLATRETVDDDLSAVASSSRP